MTARKNSGRALARWVRSMRDMEGTKDIGRRRAEVLRTEVLAPLFADATRKFLLGWGDAESVLARELEARSLVDLRASACEGIGALLAGSRGESRGQLLAMVKELAGADGALERKALTAAANVRRFERRHGHLAAPEGLHEVLDHLEGRDAVVGYLGGLDPVSRVYEMACAAGRLIELLGAEAYLDLMGWEEIEVIDHLRHFLPFLPPPQRSKALDRGLREQRKRGDDSSLTMLLLCAPWMSPVQAAEAYAQLIETEAARRWGIRLRELMEEGGLLTRSAPLLRKLGGDEVLVAAGREVVDAWKRVVLETSRGTVENGREGEGDAG